MFVEHLIIIWLLEKWNSSLPFFPFFFFKWKSMIYIRVYSDLDDHFVLFCFGIS